MRILWLKTELLHPVDKGGKIRTYFTLRELKRLHHITYLTLDDGTAGGDAREKASEYCHELVAVPHRTSRKFSAAFYLELALNLFSPLPYFMKKYESLEMRREITERLAQGNYDVVVCDSLQPNINIPSGIKTPTVLAQHNVEAMIWQRHYEVQQNPLKKFYLRGQWRKAFAYERDASHRFDQIIAVSREDAEATRRDFEVDNVVDAPTGVDTEFFRPSGKIAIEPHNLVFTGSMDWLPNEDAIQFFTRDVLPLIRQRIPDVTLTVVGRNPFPSLVKLAERDPSIVVTGRVEDVRPYMERAAAYIVPIRIGGGTRLKIYEAMAMEKPMISTTIGAEGLPVRDGVELLLADTPEAFSEAVVRVLTDEEFARGMANRAAETVRAKYGWDKVATVVADICERAVRKSSQWSVVSGQLSVEKAVPTDN